MILLKELVTDGTLAELRIGSQRSLVAQELGSPGDWDGPNTTSMTDADWWNYGDFEFHFYGQTLVKIFTRDFVDRPQFGDDNPSDPWVLNRMLTPNELKLHLEDENIEFRKICETRSPRHIDIITAPGTCLRFVPRDDDLNDHRLFAIWQENAG